MPQRLLRTLPVLLLAAVLGAAILGGSVLAGSVWSFGSAAPIALEVPTQEIGSEEDRRALIPAGTYRPLYASPTDAAGRPVDAFRLDRKPVTRTAFLAFVEANPEWRRSAVSPLFADAGYLKDWRSDLDYGPDSLGNRPVVNVSWFAARAYAAWIGARLPTTAEWERAAAASRTRENGRTDPTYRARLVAWYSRPKPATLPPVGSTTRNVWGVWDLHGLVWEWTEDFNTALVTGESRNDGDLDRQLYCGSGSVGAADFEDYAAFMRYAFRSGLDGAYTVPNLGFRTAANPTSSSPQRPSYQ